MSEFNAYFDECCASCRHWMVGSLSRAYRMELYNKSVDASNNAVCHIRQPNETHPTFGCKQHELAVMED